MMGQPDFCKTSASRRGLNGGRLGKPTVVLERDISCDSMSGAKSSSARSPFQVAKLAALEVIKASV